MGTIMIKTWMPASPSVTSRISFHGIFDNTLKWLKSRSKRLSSSMSRISKLFDVVATPYRLSKKAKKKYFNSVLYTTTVWALKPAGNFQKSAAAVFGRFPAGFLIFYFIILFLMKKTKNLPETAAAGFWRFPEVSGQSIIDGPHSIYFFWVWIIE